MPCILCGNGKYKWGENGTYMFDSLDHCKLVEIAIKINNELKHNSQLFKMEEEKLYTEKQLVEFGNYLLGKERKDKYKSTKIKGLTLSERLSRVNHSDIANFNYETSRTIN